MLTYASLQMHAYIHAHTCTMQPPSKTASEPGLILLTEHSFLSYFFVKDFIYLFMRDAQREAETEAEREAGSVWGGA